MGDKELGRTQVLIVGAGPVGLALAIELGHRSVPCVLIERNDRVGYAPRAKTTNVRTREHLRRWGIADELRAASPLGLDYPSNVTFVTRLNGHLLTKFENAMYCAPGKNPFYSEHAQWIPQYSVEEVLRAHAQSLPGVTLRFSCELLSFERGDQGVIAQIRDMSGGSTFSVNSDYLVGADGARSTVRTAIGARMDGTYGLSRNYNVVFRAPGLAQAHKHGPAIMYWQVNRDVPSVIGPMDRGDKWYFMPTQLSEGSKIAHDEVPALIRHATGIDIPIEVLSSDEWVASRLIADKYRDRSVFLAGDACHLHPPFGGYGMNMGVADGVDLGWKIAAVLQGWGGPTLLDSYERERRPVHEYVMDEAVANHALVGNQLWQDGVEDATEAGARLRAEVGARIQVAKTREFNTLGVVLGYRYDNSPVIVADGTEPTPRDFLNYVPSARPGSLAPHAWLHDGTSLYDHFGQGFTLLATNGADAHAIERAREAAHAVGVPLKYVSFGVFAEDLDSFERRLGKLDATVPHALSDGSGLWIRDPDGTPLQIVVAPKVSPSHKTQPAPQPVIVPGKGAAPSRKSAAPVRPRYLSHILLFTPDVQRQVDFYTRVLGLRVSDTSTGIVAFMHGAHASDHHLVAFAKSNAPGFHHCSWDVGSLHDVGLGAEQMRDRGYSRGWGVGRHVLGSNYFYYVRDPWGSYSEYSYDIDFIPADLDWPAADHPPEDSFYVWGPPVPEDFLTNFEAAPRA